MKHFPIREPENKYTVTGILEKTIPGLDVEFAKGGAVPVYAREQVAALPQFYRGIGIDEDPYTRVAAFDSLAAQEVNGWSDEDREYVESVLLKACGVDFVCVDQPKLKPPWPAYDKLVAVGKRTKQMVAEKIVERVAEDGYDAGAVLAYERQELNRPEVVEALEAVEATGAAPESVEEIIAA
jgi:hypothetical protein